MAAILALAGAAVILLFTGPTATAQSLSVLPVNVFFSPGQKASSLTVTNTGPTETSIQVRAFAWSQQSGDDQLSATDAVVLSPPLATIAPGASQVVRLILRQLPQGREATYRVLIDQIPPPAEPGIVHMVLRLSIPLFAQPPTRAVPHVQFQLAVDSGKLFLVGVNDGLSHEVVRDIVLSANDGRELKTEPSASPYILAGVTRRWPIVLEGPLPQSGQTLQLTAHTDAGVIKQQVGFVAAP
ncbi:MAG TPA: fimbria/pilus periplasmic chaperone [Terracidiphilus sp.]|jgi:fimbrial chaperone protein